MQKDWSALLPFRATKTEVLIVKSFISLFIGVLQQKAAY
jgi:hypothetical protein